MGMQTNGVSFMHVLNLEVRAQILCKLRFNSLITICQYLKCFSFRKRKNILRIKIDFEAVSK